MSKAGHELRQRLERLRLTEEDRRAILRFCQEASKLPYVKRILLYGSKARGDWGEDSDVDLLVLVEGLTEGREEEIWDIAHRAMWEGGFKPFLSVLVYDEGEFERLRAKGFSFALNVFEEGVEIWSERSVSRKSSGASA